MKKLVNCNKLHNIMTLATEQEYSFINSTIFFNGLYCLFSAATVKEEIPSLHLTKRQKVVTSPLIDNQGENSYCQIYSTFDVDVDSGLFLPVISWANEFTRQVVLWNEPVSLQEPYGMIEIIMQQIWELEDIIQADKGKELKLREPATWESFMDERIRWDNYDALAQAETLLKDGLITVENIALPHVHTENIESFRKAGLCKEVIIDW